jgi:ribosomal protein S18 acetylase RimI-like enzyme
MATHPDHRARGLGTALLNDCIARTRDAGGELLWCNARTGALEFYRRAGFEPVGEPFELPEIGQHVQMALNLRAGPAAAADP